MVNISQFFPTLYIALYIANSALKNHFMEGAKTSKGKLTFLHIIFFAKKLSYTKYEVY